MKNILLRKVLICLFFFSGDITNYPHKFRYKLLFFVLFVFMSFSWEQIHDDGKSIFKGKKGKTQKPNT